jgi:hypothetical protein
MMREPASRSARQVCAPDFVIAGAAKCGTTALYRYLSTHPHIAMSKRKEPYYWCPDVPVRDAVADAAEYAALWPNAAAGALRGEATPAYLRSDLAPRAILAGNPVAKFIVLLRDPMEMAASYHAQMLFSLHEDEPDFRTAWGLQDQRRQGSRIPATCFFPPDLHYAEICALGDQLERLMGAVPETQLKVILLDDLATDPRTVYLDILQFLGLADDGRNSFVPVNQNRRRKALGLVRLYRRLLRFRPLGFAARVLGIGKLIDRVMVEEAPRAALDPAFARELRAALLPQVEKLETLLMRDLQRWKTPG